MQREFVCAKCGKSEFTYDNYYKEFTCSECGFIKKDIKASEANETGNETSLSSSKRKDKKKRTYSVLGFIAGCIFLLSSLGLLIGYKSGDLNVPLSALLVTLVPGIALIVGSFKPYFNFGRGITISIGGMLFGTFPMQLMHSPQDRLGINLFTGGLGIFLLWRGLKKPK